VTEREFLRLVRSVRRLEGPRILDRSLEDLALDSLDLLELRAALEVRLATGLVDEKFVPGSTLRDLYDLVSRC
jgi:acyl carrier protein